MFYCEHCAVSVAGTNKKCPLCHCDLVGDQGIQVPLYPVPEIAFNKVYFIFKLMKFAAVLSCAICVLINYMTYTYTMWSIFVVAGVACGWIVMGIGIPRKANLIKVLQWELYITCGLAIVWDLFTGWHRWSIEFVLPCACGACMFVIVILSTILKKQPKEYLIYLALVDILGFLPLVFFALGWLEIKLPSLLCICCSALFLVGILLFKRNVAYGEIKKKLHV